jgi:hypothetical protein
MKSKQLDTSRKQPAKATVKPGSAIRKSVQPKAIPDITNNLTQSFRIDMSKMVVQIEGFPITPVKPGRKPGNANGLIRIIMDVPIAAVQPGPGVVIIPVEPSKDPKNPKEPKPG